MTVGGAGTGVRTVDGGGSEDGRSPAPWWTPMRRPPAPRSRLLVFPHSGAGPAALLTLLELLPDEVEVWGLTLPGRGDRYRESPRTTWAQVRASVEDEVGALPPLPTVLFGCSLGALLATRVAALLPEATAALVVASQSPGTRHRRADDAREEPELLAVLRDAGGMPEALLADPDVRAELLTRLAGDLRLGAEAAVEFGRVRVGAPITVFGGLSDPLVPADCLPGWAEHTTSRCRILGLDGGHFAFLAMEHREFVAAVFRQVFSTMET
ncbi:thioesterase II family protein [Allostreptomyces psammosilenae]|uniref:Pyochelin biosynthetic protein PchC n=1 Tax=Allostreptomyces psammosilenae TaxID=1892865 RepID=A0A852ZVV9_9ACTN|nr:alpha/beta fold hydrolase [Allostreptomyces psammosilenae]NYI04914.1 pyochelin biosynthetic protein PchC [Allostreptomyces psammosilenae]